MIVTTRNSEARELFAENEIGDADQDGNPEFIDGWGRPIAFIRWPAGFLTNLNADTGLQTGDATSDHDPFDPLKRDADAYRLIPLIFSYGPDGIADINRGRKDNENDGDNSDYVYGLVTVTVDGNDFLILKTIVTDFDTQLIGQPVDGETYTVVPSLLNHFDNIHNHRIEGR